MANETLVSTISSGRRDPLIEQGALLLRLLDENGLVVTAAFWLFDSENQTWKYILASPQVDIEGPLTVYKTLQRYVGEAGLTLQDIAVVGSHDSLVDLLRVEGSTSPTSIASIRFTASTIRNVFIDDAYIYRVA